jgi:hypothetical protein
MPAIERWSAIPMNNHNRIYNVLLIVLAFFLSVSIITFVFVRRAPTTPPESQWAFAMAAYVNAALVTAIIATLILRAAAPRAGRIATTALNTVLLLVIPLGTAVGIYGLLKVDTDGQPAAG